MKQVIFFLSVIVFFSSCEKKNKPLEINYDTITLNNSPKKRSIGNQLPKIDSNIISINESNIYEQEVLPKQIKKFIPSDYSVINITKGNLNLDKLEDIILVLGKHNEDSISTNETPVLRRLILLTGTTNENFILAGKTDSLVYYYGFDVNFKDAFTGITIKNGYFSIEHYGGFRPRWTRVTTFKFSPSENNWLFHKDGIGCFDTVTGESCKDKIYTTKDYGLIPFNKFNIYKDNEATQSMRRFPY